MFMVMFMVVQKLFLWAYDSNLWAYNLIFFMFSTWFKTCYKWLVVESGWCFGTWFFFPYLWINYNDLTVLPHWKSWLIRGIIPKIATSFRLVQYDNLPRKYGYPKSSKSSGVWYRLLRRLWEAGRDWDDGVGSKYTV